ncbi:MAG: hypothetical protein R2794_08560 [Chitinophagales bacterium]
MLRRGYIILLLSVYAIGLFQPFAPILDYVLHKTYIEENLCVNRDVPDSDCHGMCYVTKEIAQNVDDIRHTANTPAQLKLKDDVRHLSMQDLSLSYPVSVPFTYCYVDISLQDQYWENTVKAPPKA